jgi:hypothetical protein
VPQNRPFTFYVRHGELFAEFCAAVTLIAIGVIAIRAKVFGAPAAAAICFVSSGG